MEAAILGGIFVAVCYGSGILIVRQTARSKRKNQRTRVLEPLALQVGGTVFESGISGTRNHVRFELRCVTRSNGESDQPWTEIDVGLPAGYPLVLLVRRERPTDWGLVDVQLGDQAFDREFLVEAAPEDVTKLLLDGQARKFLVACNAELSTETHDGRKVVRLAIPRWFEDPSAAISAIDCVTSIRSRIRDAFALDTIRTAEGGAPFRPVPDDTAARTMETTRMDEMATLERLRSTHKRIGTIMFVGIVAASIITVALGIH